MEEILTVKERKEEEANRNCFSLAHERVRREKITI
jgi:hypothetical protein